MRKSTKPKIIKIALIVIVILIVVALLARRLDLTHSSSTKIISTPTVQSTPPPIATNIVIAHYYYPISNYASRKTLKWYGKKVTATDNKAEMCGANFTGYHTGDDLEILSGELNIDVPVYSIAAGVVRQVSAVSGYGGLIVIEYNLNNQIVTAYFGHINLASAQVKVGDQVKAGQKLANLGAACTAQTDGERKHLHFAIRQGTAIDVRGYVQTQSELSAWLDPTLLLGKLSPANP